MLKSKNVLFFMSGSISCFKACEIISSLKREGAHVKVVTTPNTSHFIGSSTLEGLSENSVQSNSFTPGKNMEHIALTKWADFALFAPATAKSLNSIAQGVGEGLVYDLCLAWSYKSKPFFIAPAMNTNMYNHATTQNSIQTLKKWGCEVFPTNEGRLACGDYGQGRLLEPSEIITKIKKYFLNEQKKSSNQAVLITYGGTQTPIDNVRKISNSSTGQTGFEIAEAFSLAGFSVTALRSSQAQKSEFVDHDTTFTTFHDFQTLWKDRLTSHHYTAIIHLAAISDFEVESLLIDNVKIYPPIGKVSSQDHLSIQLKRTPKLINSAKSYSKNKNVYLIGFKLTSEAQPSDRMPPLQKMIQNSPVDLIVHNDTHEIQKEKKQHIFHVFNLNQEKEVTCRHSSELAQYLISKVSLIRSQSLKSSSTPFHSSEVSL